MLRPRAVREMLVEDVASVRLESEDRTSEGCLHALRAARRKALAFALLCGTALVVLIFARVPADPDLAPGFGSLYLTGLVVIAVAAGFRLGQAEKLRAVERVVEDLDP